jgi:flagellar protein FliS
VKGAAIGKAMDIITYLQSCLDKEGGGEIAHNLDALYGYMIGCLLRASSQNSPGLLDEVSSLMRDVSAAWATIRGVANKAPNHELASAIG